MTTKKTKAKPKFPDRVYGFVESDSEILRITDDLKQLRDGDEVAVYENRGSSNG